ncbi:MAG: hypothetical protein AAF609_22900 [Cyanobacteria bacterium P01_C01_bin.120]
MLKKLKTIALEALAAVVGLGLVMGQRLEPAVADEVNCNDGQCDWPSQRRGSGVHFWERIGRAKYLGQLPGLRKAAIKLQEPRGLTALMAEYGNPSPSPTQIPPLEMGGVIAEGERDPRERVRGTRG